MVTVTILYMLVNGAYYTMMTEDELLISDAVAVVSMKGISWICLKCAVPIFFFNWERANHSLLISFSLWHTDFCQQSPAQDGIPGAFTGGHVLSWDHEWGNLFNTKV